VEKIYVENRNLTPGNDCLTSFVAGLVAIPILFIAIVLVANFLFD
jgi:hypothetical protein